jgi:signal transduction histidine kinase
MLGRLTVGSLLDDHRAAELRGLTGGEIAFAVGDQVLASSLANAKAAIATMLPSSGIQSVVIGDQEFLALVRPLGPPGSAVALVLRSRTERLRFLSAIRARLLGVFVLTVVAATVLSYVVARTMTRPLTRLTEFVAQVQQEAAQRERLSALGRLSTVIAHEVRNPLMIIKASLASLRGPRLDAAELRDAVADIEEETNRLNRVVTEVLDFAKPIRFELAQADINAICRQSAEAAWAGQPADDLAIDLDPRVPAMTTDAERLRTALVNLIANAQHSLTPARTTAADHNRAAVTVATRFEEDRVVIAIKDRGAGIAPEHVPHIFDPYFTTSRTGTGLGLPIAKNIIEGLHGTLRVASTSGVGTEIRVEFPLETRA